MQKTAQIVAFSTAILFVIHPTDVKASKKIDENSKKVISSEYENAPLRKFREEKKFSNYNGDRQYGELTPNLRELEEYKKSQISSYSNLLTSTRTNDSDLEHAFFEIQKESAIYNIVDDSVTSQDFDAIDIDNFLFKLMDKSSTVEEKKILLLNAPKELINNSAVCKQILIAISEYGNQIERITLLKALVKRGVPVATMKIDKLDQTTLHIAAARGADLVVSYLLENGANINSTNQFNHTPVKIAQLYRMENTVGLLVENGAICNRKNLLTWAIEKKYVKLIVKLVDCGTGITESTVKNIGHLGLDTQKFLRSACSLFTPSKNNFDMHILQQLNNNPDAAKNFTEILTFAGSRDQRFLEKLFETIKFYFSQEEREAFNFTYNNSNELCLAIAKNTKSPSKRAAWAVKIFDVCTGNIFKAGEELTPFEKEIKALVTDKKLFDDKTRNRLKNIYEKQLFNKQLNSTNKHNKFIDIAFKFN